MGPIRPGGCGLSHVRGPHPEHKPDREDMLPQLQANMPRSLPPDTYIGDMVMTSISKNQMSVMTFAKAQ